MPRRLTGDALAVERTRLANERTLLAYARTGVGIAAAGATVLTVFDTTKALAFGVAVTLLGALALAVGVARYFAADARIRGVERDASE